VIQMANVTDIKAQCRMSTGGIHEISVLDISEAGCMIGKRMLRLQVDERLLIKLPNLAYQAATVLWVDDDRAGLVFEQPLYSAILTHLQAHQSTCFANTMPKRPSTSTVA